MKSPELLGEVPEVSLRCVSPGLARQETHPITMPDESTTRLHAHQGLLHHIDVGGFWHFEEEQWKSL